MKILSLLLALLFTANMAFAQQDTTKQEAQQFQTIFGNSGEKTKISGFGAFVMDFGGVENNFGLNLGFEGAVLINRSFFIGLYGRVLVTTPSYEYQVLDNDHISNIDLKQQAFFGHGGLLVGYVFMPAKPIHFGISTRFGMGGITLFDDYSHGGMYDPNYTYYDYPYLAPLYVFSPQLDLEMNITTWFKFRASVGYQFVSNSTLDVQMIDNGSLIQKELLNTSGYSTPTFSLGFVFGMFK